MLTITYKPTNNLTNSALLFLILHIVLSAVVGEFSMSTYFTYTPFIATV